jgi:hypothetical protein
MEHFKATAINPGMPIPKDGTVGYVKFENPNDYVGETEPRWIDVDEYEYEAIS